jgi:hypothetical protein
VFGLVALGLLLILLILGALLIYSRWEALTANHETAPAAPAPAPSEEERLCWEFARLKNAGDRQADRLLGPPPVVPDRAVSRPEADRLDAEFILRQPFRITKVRRLPERGAGGAPRLKLVGKGSVRSERFLVEGDAQPSQRMLFNPDLIVEVRDGKLYGVRAQLSDD